MSREAILPRKPTAIDISTNSSSGPLAHNQRFSVVGARFSNWTEEIEVRNPWGKNPKFVANKDGYGATNNGYMGVSTASVWLELSELIDG